MRGKENKKNNWARVSPKVKKYIHTKGHVLTIHDNREEKKQHYKYSPAYSLASGFDKQLQNTNTLYQYWGLDNQFPKHWMRMIERNPIVGGLLSKVVDFVTGQQYCLIKQKVEKGKIIVEYIPETEYTEIWDWLLENDWQQFAMKVITDWAYLGKAPVEFIRAKSKNKIAKVNHIDTTLHRIGEFDYKPITHILADWQFGTINLTKDSIPNLDCENPLKYEKSILQINTYKPGQYRYTTPFYVGAEKSIELLNKIFDFHLGGLTNGYVIRYHIEIPSDYFNNYEDPDKAEEDLRADLDNFMSKPENAGKSLITYYDSDLQNGKSKEGIKITPINSQLNDDAFTAIFDQAQISICSAIGMNPELGGVVMQGSMSGNSGSGIRNAHNQYVNLTVPTIRDITLNRIFNIVKKANNWDKSVRLGYIDHQIEKLDENPTGNSTGVNFNGSIT